MPTDLVALLSKKTSTNSFSSDDDDECGSDHGSDDDVDTLTPPIHSKKVVLGMISGVSKEHGWNSILSWRGQADILC